VEKSGERLRFGFVLQQPRRAEVEALEALPIDSIWCGGHIAFHGAPEAMMQLGRLAAFTERVRIGTSILLLPLYQPAVIAKQVADLDVYTGGRVALGIGVGGESPEEFRACGIPLAERGARTNEAMAVLRALWTGEEVTQSGRFYPMERVRILPQPKQIGGPPIIVAGRQEAAMRRAALLGDGWMPYLYSPRRYAESVKRIGAFAAEAGRSLDGFEWTHFLNTHVDDDPEAAKATAAGALGGVYNQDFSQMIEKVAAVGNAEQVARRAQEFVDAGARHVIFAIGHRLEDRIGMARKIAAEVMPRIVLPA
jgi:probable F420-dependent oxidoreductase